MLRHLVLSRTKHKTKHKPPPVSSPSLRGRTKEGEHGSQAYRNNEFTKYEKSDKIYFRKAKK